jgi:hypothetical protein
MTVKDVIDELSKHDPRLPVAFQSFHPGWDGVRDIRIVPVVIAEDENHGADFHNHRTNGGSHDGPAMLCVGLV